MDPLTLRVLERFIKGSKPLQKGSLVRYVGAQSPRLAGMEGEIVEVDGDRFKVAWRNGQESSHVGYELKAIRSYSKRFRFASRPV